MFNTKRLFDLVKNKKKPENTEIRTLNSERESQVEQTIESTPSSARYSQSGKVMEAIIIEPVDDD